MQAKCRGGALSPSLRPQPTGIVLTSLQLVFAMEQAGKAGRAPDRVVRYSILLPVQCLGVPNFSEQISLPVMIQP